MRTTQNWLSLSYSKKHPWRLVGLGFAVRLRYGGSFGSLIKLNELAFEAKRFGPIRIGFIINLNLNFVLYFKYLKKIAIYSTAESVNWVAGY